MKSLNKSSFSDYLNSKVRGLKVILLSVIRLRNLSILLSLNLTKLLFLLALPPFLYCYFTVVLLCARCSTRIAPYLSIFIFTHSYSVGHMLARSARGIIFCASPT